MATQSVVRQSLDLSDPRTVKAVEIAATAGQWAKCRTSDGRKLYGVPAQSEPGRFYLANCSECECPDFARRLLPCKHVLAVRLHCATVKAHRPRRAAKAANPAKAAPAPVLPVTVTPLAIAAERARDRELAARYDAIYGGDA